MKNIIRVPTVQYGYIETEFEGTADEAIVEHNRLVLTHKLSAEAKGLVIKDWNKTLDRYLTSNVISSDAWEEMDTSQKYIINEIKKSIKRTTSTS
jgi:Fe-S cluster biosynthesis and repair protein YggX